MFPPADLLRSFDGVARGALLQRFGCSRKTLSAAVRTGTIERVRAGVFALPSANRQIVTAAAHGGSLSCAAALRLHGIWTLPQENAEIHVWMGASGRRHEHEPCECTTHYSAGTADIGIAPVAVALVHFYRCGNDDEAFFAAYESAWEKRLITARDRAQIRRELPRRAHWMLDLARSDAASGLESLLRLRLHLLGIRLDCQVEIDGVGRVDFVVGGRVILETDGRENHEGERRHNDLIRDAAASALGYETLRFDYAMVVHDWERVAAAILPAIDRSRA